MPSQLDKLIIIIFSCVPQRPKYKYIPAKIKHYFSSILKKPDESMSMEHLLKASPVLED